VPAAVLGMAIGLLPVVGCGRPKARDAGREAPRGYRSEIHCPCGYRGPHDVQRVARLLQEGRTIERLTGGFLMPCPACGNTTAYLVTIAPDGSVEGLEVGAAGKEKSP